MSFFRKAVAAVSICIFLGVAANDCLAQGATTNGTVTFQVAGSKTGGPVMTTLTVKKNGKKEIVNGPSGNNTVDGRHNFPKNSTTAGIGAYYRLLLNNAGWVEGTDFSISGGQINFFGIEKLDGGASNKQVSVNGTTDSLTIQYQSVAPKPLKKRMRIERNGATRGGSITLVAFGIKWDTVNHTITTSTSEVKVLFLAGDSASQLLQKIHDALDDAGWTASIDGGWLTIEKNAAGHDIYSLWHSILYEGEGENGDHWVFLDGE